MAAKSKTTTKKAKDERVSFITKSKKKRKGVHAKTKTSHNKKSKNYKKPKVGQG